MFFALSLAFFFLAMSLYFIFMTGHFMGLKRPEFAAFSVLMAFISTTGLVIQVNELIHFFSA